MSPEGVERGAYVYNGIDRIDSEIGYTKDNCVSCCGTCNKMKMALPLKFFLDHVRKIASHQGDRE